MIKVFCLALPDDQNVPAHFLQGLLVPSVTMDIAVQLVLPELAPGGGEPVCRAARMAMPEASVDKDRLAAWSEYQIGTARQFPGVEAVAITHAVNEPPDHHLGFRILGGDPTHQLAALSGSKRITPRPPLLQQPLLRVRLRGHGSGFPSVITVAPRLS